MTAKTSGHQAETVATKAKAPEGGAAPDNGVAAATGFEASGAPAQVVPDVDPDHPAVDNDPRAGTTAEQNRIDWNDPAKPAGEMVAEQLGMKTAD